MDLTTWFNLDSLWVDVKCLRVANKGNYLHKVLADLNMGY